MSQILIPSSSNTSNFNLRELIDADEKFDLGTSFEKIEGDTSQNKIIEDGDKPKATTRKWNQTNSPNESLVEHRLSGPKHKVLINSINFSIQNFITNYGEEIFEQIISKYIENINELIEEKYSKKFVIFKNYHSQIAEMELMMKDDDGHRESIQSIIDSLEDDKEKEIEKIESEFNELIKEKQKILKEMTLNKNSVLEEKFKIEMLGILNEIIYTKK